MRAADEEVVLTRPRTRGRWSGWLVAALVLAVGVGALQVLFVGAREKARSNNCLSNLKCVTLNLIMYAADNGDRFPPASNWVAASRGCVANSQELICPSDDRYDQFLSGSLTTSYPMNTAAGGVKAEKILYPAELPVLFDGNGICGGPEAAVFRHWRGRERRLNMSFADGHATSLSQEEFAAVQFQPKPRE